MTLVDAYYLFSCIFGAPKQYHQGLLHQPLEHHLPILQHVVLVVGKQFVHNNNHKVGPLGQEVVQQHQHVEGGVADWLLT